MENTNWLILLLARDFFGLGLTLGQFIAILLSVAMVCCVISSNTWAVVLLLPVTLWLAGVGIGWCVNVFFLSLLVYLIVIRQVPVLMALFIFIAILLCEWLLFPAVFQSMFTTSDKMQMIAEEHGTGGGTQASSSPSSSAPSGSTTVQEKVLKPNAVALWWDGLNLNPGEKPRNPIPAGISCSFITDQAPAMTAIAKEIYQVQCWSGDWSAEGECNGYFARGVGVVAKKGVVTQVDGKGQYPGGGASGRSIGPGSCGGREWSVSGKGYRRCLALDRFRLHLCWCDCLRYDR